TCTPKYSARYRLDVQASLVKIVPTRKPSLVRRLVNRLAKPAPRKLPKSILDLALPRGQAGVANNPEDIDARLYLGMIYRNTGQYKEAAEQLNKAIELDESRPEPYYELSFVYEKNNQINKAIRVLAKAIERAPEFEWAYYRLGTIYLDSGKIDKAVQVLKATLALNPLSADTHFFLGQAYEKQGEPELALAEYEESLEYVPDFLEAKAAIRRLAN
ncbi:MAG: tetratricopeptide repeat protein, partial [Actinomycetia bacterium]|nr:tetratricopeptide repeat protein [Actinomycetes bacterium]